MKSKDPRPGATLITIGLCLSVLVAVLHWYDTTRLNEQAKALEEHVCDSLRTQQTKASLEQIASGYLSQDELNAATSVSVEPLRGILGSYRLPGWTLSGTAYFGRGGRWWFLLPWGKDTLTEVNRAPDAIVNASRSECSVQPGPNRNEVDVVMPFQFGELETAIVVHARRNH